MKSPSGKAPRCIIIAGPNGAGKTTFAREFLPRDAGVLHFVNADLIAGGLSPLRPRLGKLPAALPSACRPLGGLRQFAADTATVGDRAMKPSQPTRTGRRPLTPAGRALRRSARVARKTARAHGTPIYLWRDGRVVAEKP
jgi:hypothetical protein